MKNKPPRPRLKDSFPKYKPDYVFMRKFIGDLKKWATLENSQK
jgi:hypothetical protein